MVALPAVAFGRNDGGSRCCFKADEDKKWLLLLLVREREGL
jgi:hypothetical protein